MGLLAQLLESILRPIYSEYSDNSQMEFWEKSMGLLGQLRLDEK